MHFGRDFLFVYDSHPSWVDLHAIRTGDMSQELDFILFKLTLGELDIVLVI